MNHVTTDITEVINAIRNLTGAGICYYDLNEFFGYQKYGEKNNRGHYCAFCERARSLPGGRLRCNQSDKMEAVDLAKQYKVPFFHECHMGMQELVIPLFSDDRLIGVLFIGQCRTEAEREGTIRENARKMNGDPKEFIELYNVLPLIQKQNLLSIGTILSRYFDTKILSNELLRPMGYAEMGNRNLAEAIHQYIRQNYRFPISTGNIAEEFYVNESYASRCFSQMYHITITEYIAKVRIEHAKILLTTTDVPIGSISLNVGFDDANYFTRIFKKRTGCSPTEFRKSNQKNI